MPEDIFVEVKSIEERADLALAEARADAEKAVADAEAELAGLEEKAQDRLESESRRLRDENEQHLSHKQTTLEDAFHRRKAHLEEVAQKHIDALADWVVSRFMEDHE